MYDVGDTMRGFETGDRFLGERKGGGGRTCIE